MPRTAHVSVREALADLAYPVVSARARPWSWLTPVTVSVAAVAAAVSGALGGGWLVVCGVGAGIAAGYPFAREWATRVDRRIELDEASQLRVALRNALQPLSERIARMPAMSPGRRRNEIEVVATDAASPLVQILNGVDQLRAVVYELDEAGAEMTPLAYQGRGGTRPTGFVSGTGRGDSAIRLVLQNRKRFVRNVAEEPSPDYEGSGEGYQTFISVSINDGTNAYGMLTLDAPEAGALVQLDVYVLEVVANLVAIAFAIGRA